MITENLFIVEDSGGIIHLKLRPHQSEREGREGERERENWI